MHLAACQGHTAVVQLLLDAGAAVSTQSADGFSPLQGAARRGHVAVVQLLLDTCANVVAAATGAISA